MGAEVDSEMVDEKLAAEKKGANGNDGDASDFDNAVERADDF